MHSVKDDEEFESQKEKVEVSDVQEAQQVGSAESTQRAGILEIKDEDELLRLLFDSESYNNGLITNEAIPSRDLKANGFSLDIREIASLETINARAQTQAQKILLKNPDSEKRKVAFISTLINSELLSCVDESGRQLFETMHTPQDDNNAHASLYCILRGENPNYYVYARNQVKPLLIKSAIELSKFKL